MTNFILHHITNLTAKDFEALGDEAQMFCDNTDIYYDASYAYKCEANTIDKKIFNILNILGTINTDSVENYSGDNNFNVNSIKYNLAIIESFPDIAKEIQDNFFNTTYKACLFYTKKIDNQIEFDDTSSRSAYEIVKSIEQTGTLKSVLDTSGYYSKYLNASTFEEKLAWILLSIVKYTKTNK